jgi:DNA-directed RNA polymerase subunit omega
LEQLVEKTGSRFAVVVAAAKRAKQIKDGSPPLVETGSKNPLTIALAEIAQGKVLIVPTEGEEEEEPVTNTFEQYFAGREKGADEPLPYRRPPREPRAREEGLDDDEEDEEDDPEDEDEESDDDE